MIDVNEYKRKFEARCLASGLKKLDQPEETDEFLYCAMVPGDNDRFDLLFWEPTMDSIIRAIILQNNGEFYFLDVYYRNNFLVITASRGEANGGNEPFN